MISYLLRGLALNGSIAFLILEAVQGIIFTVRATEGYSFDILIIFPVLLASFALAISYTLPLALLFGTSLLAGRLNADRELLALRSFGVSPAQIALPAVIVGGVLSFAAYYFNTEWAPSLRFANRHAETMILDRLGYLGEGWNLSYNADAWTLWINHYDGPAVEGLFMTTGAKGGRLLVSDEVLQKIQAPSYPIYMFAERGLVARGTGVHEGKLVIELQNVTLFFDNELISLVGPRYGKTDAAESSAPAPAEAKLHETRSKNFLQKAWLSNWIWPIDFQKDAGAISVKDMSASDLREETVQRRKKLKVAVAAGKPEAISFADGQYWYAVTEFHRRLAMSLSVLTFPLAAFVIGLFVTSSNRLLPFFISTTVVPSLYFSCEMFGSFVAKKGIAPWASQELGNIALGAVIATLIWKLSRGPRR